MQEVEGRGPGAHTADAEDITAGAGNNNENKPGAEAGAGARWRGDKFQRWRLATTTNTTNSSGGEGESLEQRKLRSVLEMMGLQQKKVQRAFTWDTKTQEQDTRPRR